MDFSGAVVNDETMENGPNMVIKQVSLGIGVIDEPSNDKFGLALERKINVSNKFDTLVARGNEDDAHDNVSRNICLQ